MGDGGDVPWPPPWRAYEVGRVGERRMGDGGVGDTLIRMGDPTSCFRWGSANMSRPQTYTNIKIWDNMLQECTRYTRNIYSPARATPPAPSGGTRQTCTCPK